MTKFIESRWGLLLSWMLIVAVATVLGILRTVG